MCHGIDVRFSDMSVVARIQGCPSKQCEREPRRLYVAKPCSK